METIRATEQRVAAQVRRRGAAKILDLARRGFNNPMIAKIAGVDPATVARVLAVDKVGGVAELFPRRSVDRTEIRRLIAAGVPKVEITRRLGISFPAIQRALRADPRNDLAAQLRAVERGRRAREVRELRSRGLSQNAIASTLGVSRSMVRRLDEPPWPWKLRELHTQGLSQDAIAGVLGISRSVIRRSVGRLRQAQPDDRVGSPRERALAVLALARQHVPWEQIAARLHVSFTTINRVLSVENAGGTATIQLRRRLQRRQDARRLRILQAHGIAKSGKRVLGPAEIARRLGLSVLTVRIYLASDFRCTREIAAQRRVEQRKQRAQQVRALRVQGLSQDDIARKLGISHGTVGNDLSKPPQSEALLHRTQRARDLYLKETAVSDIVAELRVQPKRVRQYLGFPGDRVQWRSTGEVRRLARRGVTNKKIAQRLGVPIGTVKRVQNTGRVLLQDKFAAQVHALYAQGLSKQAIGHELNLSSGTIRRALEKRVVRRARIPLHPDRQRALRVLTLVAAGLSKEETHRRLGISLHTVRRVVRMAEAGKAVTIRPTSKPDEKRVRQLFKAGIAVYTIARRLRRSVRTIQAILELGQQPIPPDTVARIRELHAGGVSKDQVAKELKVKLQDVYRILPPARDLIRSPPTAALPARHRMPRRRALTIKAFAEQHGLDISNVRAAISDGMLATLVVGKTILIPHTESARLLREAYLQLSKTGADPEAARQTAADPEPAPTLQNLTHRR